MLTQHCINIIIYLEHLFANSSANLHLAYKNGAGGTNENKVLNDNCDIDII